jgi:hypothetical protein
LATCENLRNCITSRVRSKWKIRLLIQYNCPPTVGVRVQVEEGDQVVFVLVGLSEFIVFTFNPDGLRKITRHNCSLNTCIFSTITKPPVQPVQPRVRVCIENDLSPVNFSGYICHLQVADPSWTGTLLCYVYLKCRTMFRGIVTPWCKSHVL